MTERKGDLDERLVDLRQRFPPGPKDSLDDDYYDTLLLAVEVGLLTPTGEFRDGHRVWEEAPHRYSLTEFPPGPRDDVLLYGMLFKLADDGVVRPTRRLRNGQRIFKSLSPYEPKAGKVN